MVIGRTTALVTVLASIIALGLLSLALPPWRARTAPAGDEAERRAALEELRGRVLPAAEGGWTIGDRSPEPAHDRWLLAALALGAPADRALAAAAADLDGDAAADPAVARRSAMAVAVALGPREAGSEATSLAEGVWRVALDLRAADDASWLMLMLQLARSAAPAGARARAALVEAAGRPSCAWLADEPLPPPGGALVVRLRSLTAAGRRCSAAGPLLDRALADARWRSAIAIEEVVDLVELLPPGRPVPRGALEQRFGNWADPADGEVSDLSRLAALRRGWAAIGVAPRWPIDVQVRLGSLVRSEGRIADRALQPAGALDLLAMLQLEHAGLLPSSVVSDTRAHLALDAGGSTAVAAGEALVLRGAVPPCDAPAPGLGRRPHPVALLAAGAWQAQVAGCRGRPPVAEVAAEAAAAKPGVRAFRVIGVVLGACRAESEALAARVPLDLDGDPFADDAVGLLARALAADPARACAAMGWDR